MFFFSSANCEKLQLERSLPRNVHSYNHFYHNQKYDFQYLFSITFQRLKGESFDCTKPKKLPSGDFLLHIHPQIVLTFCTTLRDYHAKLVIFAFRKRFIKGAAYYFLLMQQLNLIEKNVVFISNKVMEL